MAQKPQQDVSRLIVTSQRTFAKIMTTLETEYNVRLLSFLSPFPSDFCNGSFNSLYVEQSRRIPVVISTRGQSSFNSVAPQPLNQIRGKSPSTRGLKKSLSCPGFMKSTFRGTCASSIQLEQGEVEERIGRWVICFPSKPCDLCSSGRSHRNYRSPCIQNRFPSAFIAVFR